MSTVGQGQLTFDVVPHPDAVNRPGGLQVAGSLKISGTLTIPQDLQHGDELLITVCGADGEVIARQQAVIAAPPSFVPIEDKDLGLLGYERAHKAKVTDEV